MPGVRGGKTLQTWDTCITAIVYGDGAERAQKTFEDWCRAPRGGEDPPETEIKKIVGAEIIGQLLTESGTQNLDWSEISRKSADSGSAPAVDAEETKEPEDLGEGFWVDVNVAVPVDGDFPDIEALKRALPEDIVSGVNWSPEKTFLFLVTSLSAPPLVTELNEDIEDPDSDEPEAQDQREAEPSLDEWVNQLPEMRDKEAAALVEARNSVVAAWLWRKFAANTRLALNEIMLGPCCFIMPAN